MQKLLEEIGLSSLEACIYSYICDTGLTSASKISRMTGIQRSMCYIVLASLVDKNLIIRDESKKIARFALTNPEALSSLVHQQTETAKQAETAFHSVIEQIKQQFAIQSGQPGVRFYGGTEGLKALYRNINDSGVKEIYLVRSRIHPDQATSDIINAQVEKQLQLNIMVKVINSTADPGFEKYLLEDKARLVDRRIIPAEIYKNPSQIIIYGNKVGFTTYRSPMITVVIEHEDIATTMHSMYSYIWKKAEIDTNYYLSSHTK